MNKQEKTKSPHNHLKQTHRWWMAVFGLIILLAGIFIGASSMFLVRRKFKPPYLNPEAIAEVILEREKNILNLSSEQVEKLKPIFKNHIEKFDEMRAAAREQITEQLKLMNDEVSSILDENQRKLWQQHLKDMQRRWPPRRGRPGSHKRPYEPEQRYRRDQNQPDITPPPLPEDRWQQSEHKRD